ncbi:MAG: hypothetical protein K6G78_03305 [bacterium]|nr:hypothetical protein [bacterium]
MALAAVFMFALCACIAFGSTQKAYAGWDNSHEHYYHGETMVTDDIVYVSEDGAYYFKPNGLVGKGWCSYDWGDPSWIYGDPSTGKLKLGWQKIGGYWYYFAPKSGWTEDGHYDYVVGTMYHHGAAKVNGKWYYFGRSDSGSKWGKMQYGWISDTSSGDKV